MTKPTVLFIHPTAAPDLLEDQALLAEAFHVAPFHFNANRPGGALGRLAGVVGYGFKQAVWLLRVLPSAACVYGCFADYHMVLPVWLARRFGVPVAIRLGGFDGNTLPALGYGVFLSRWRGPLARYVLRHADLLLPVTPSLIHHQNPFAAWPAVLENGVRAHVPDLHTPHVVIPTGYDPAAWPAGTPHRAPLVTTVGYVGDERTVRVKGVDLLVAAARLLPDVAFQVVGVAPHMVAVLRDRFAAPANVALRPPVDRGALAAIYTESSVYAQLSRTEGGLPNVVAEAMLCGCIPVVSAAGSMAETVGAVGTVVATPEPERIAAAIRTSLAADPAARRRARARIAEQFTLARRQERLIEALTALGRPAP